MKKFAAILLALMLMLSCMAMASALPPGGGVLPDPDWTDSPVEVYFKGMPEAVVMPADMYLKVDGESGTKSDYDFYYDSETRTLKLNSAVFDGALILNEDVGIELIGNSVITGDGGNGAYPSTLIAYETVAIIGSGRLTLIAEPSEGDITRAVAADVIGQLVMHGSTLTVEAKDADISGGIIADSIVVGKNTTLKATAGDAKISIGVQAIEGIYVDGGKVHAQAGNAEFSSYGVISYEDINVISGSLYAVSGDTVDGVSSAFAISEGDLHLGENLKLFTAQKPSDALAEGETVFAGAGKFPIVKGGEAPAQHALVNTNANIPKAGDMSNPALWLAMVGMALVVMVAAAKKRAVVR